MHYPYNEEELKKYTLQSALFGHRIKIDQSLYEYMLEFLQVLISPKAIDEKGLKKKYASSDYFPLDNDFEKYTISYYPFPRIGFKRFVFFNKSKQESRFPIDSKAYEECVDAIKEKIEIDSNIEFLDKDYSIDVIQSLFYGLSAVIKNRSWFAQSLLPVCPEVILPEAMGDKKKRKKMNDYDIYKAEVDNEFEFHRYNFMARGGEVYYLHLLRAINNNPEFKQEIEQGFRNLITKFPQFSKITNFIHDTWMERYAQKIKSVTKSLGSIPIGYERREKYTIIELCNFLKNNLHPFEKIDILAHGIILQILRMMHEQACKANDKERPSWIVDMRVDGKSGDEIKKISIKSYADCEADFLEVLYKYVGEYDKKKDEVKTIVDASNQTYKLFRKLGKELGIIIPITGPGMRFALSEKIVKFLVLSIIPPKGKLTLDSFIEKLYEHYGIVIDRKCYKKEVHKNKIKNPVDLSIFDRNKDAFQQLLKECGFLRDLSDATSIVENPYGKEVWS